MEAFSLTFRGLISYLKLVRLTNGRIGYSQTHFTHEANSLPHNSIKLYLQTITFIGIVPELNCICIFYVSISKENC